MIERHLADERARIRGARARVAFPEGSERPEIRFQRRGATGEDGLDIQVRSCLIWQLRLAPSAHSINVPASAPGNRGQELKMLRPIAAATPKAWG